MPDGPDGLQHHPGDDRDRAPVRADLLGRAGDPALEDAARRDLHRADPRQPGAAGADTERRPGPVGPIDVGQISGGDAPHPIPEGGHLAQTQVQDQTQIDEIFQGFDKPTREAFQSWMQNSALAVNGRGLDLNDAFGNLGPFASDASDVLGTLRSQEQSLRTLVHDTGDVFAALTEHDQALAGAIVGANRTFGALASQSRALSDTFKIFPTFENESRLTLDRLKGVRRGRPAGVPRPAAGRPRPEPDPSRCPQARAERAQAVQEPRSADQGVGDRAALAESFVRELRPVMDGLDPFLANFNPLRALARLPGARRHRLPLQPVIVDGRLPAVPGGPERAASPLAPDDDLHRRVALDLPTRLATNRGNGYLQPFAIGSSYPTHPGGDLPEPRLQQHLRRPGQRGCRPRSARRRARRRRRAASSRSSLVDPATPSLVGPNFRGNPTRASGGPSAYAACTSRRTSRRCSAAGDPEVLPDQ